MIALLIILIVACLVWLFHPRFNPQFAKPKQRDTDHSPDLSPKEANIMGKSTFVLRHPQPNKATESQTDKGVDKERTFDSGEPKQGDAQIPKEKLDEVFSNTPEPENDPMDVDISAEYEAEEDADLDEEAEELRQILGNNIHSADGVGYDDLNEANQTALADNPSPEEQERAGAVFHKIQPTDMFEQMVSGNIEKEDKVKMLMAMHLKKYYIDTETTEIVKHDLSGFIN